MQYRAQLLKGQCIVGGCSGFYTFLNLKYFSAQLQQQGAEMQQALPSELIFRPGYFKYVKIDQGAKGERKLQWQPVPAGEVGLQSDINTQ